MRRIFAIIILNIAVLFFIISLSFAASATKDIKAGNQLYKAKKFDEALEKYNQAEIALPDSDIVNFNTAAALYKKKDYQKAAESFTEALTTDDRNLEAKVNYNIGNCKYRQGMLKENTDLAAAISLYRESLDYYKRAIDLSEKDEDAKYNHEFVEKRLKILLDELKQQQQKKGEEKKQEQEGKPQAQPAPSKEEKPPEAEKKETEKKETEEKKAEEKKAAEEKEAPKAEQAQLAQEEPEEMSEEEARMLLEGYMQEEESKGKIKGRRKGYYPEVVKDW